jgi:hypothetical protein
MLLGIPDADRRHPAVGRDARVPVNEPRQLFDGRDQVSCSGASSSADRVGPDSVWASDGGSLWHFNGKAWTRSNLPFTVLDTLSAAPDGDLWAAGIVKSTPPNYLCAGYAIAIYA